MRRAARRETGIEVTGLSVISGANRLANKHPSREETMTHEDKLIEHLSKEIETLTNNLMIFRTRCNFAVFVGPFVLLGSVLIAAKGNLHGLSIDRWIIVSSVGLVLSYATMGIACSSIEAHMWKQCNAWRRLIARITSDDSAKIGEEELEFGQTILKGYVITYAAMIIAFFCVIYIISHLNIVSS